MRSICGRPVHVHSYGASKLQRLCGFDYDCWCFDTETTRSQEEGQHARPCSTSNSDLSQIIAAPEVIQVIQELPVLADLTKSLYDCVYDKFFIALGTPLFPRLLKVTSDKASKIARLEQANLIPSRVLNPHARYYVREMRILAYAQLLESYRSLTLESLATAFGVSVAFVDNELSRFIALGRLNCTIDRVHGVVETNRPSAKNAQYETVIRQGDILLNSVQKLSKVLY